VTREQEERIPLIEGVRDRLNRLRAAEIEASSVGDMEAAEAMFRDYEATRVMATEIATQWKARGWSKLANLMVRVVSAV
jgi:hypothetical protein